jgi:hypothetical protein
MALQQWGMSALSQPGQCGRCALGLHMSVERRQLRPSDVGSDSWRDVNRSVSSTHLVQGSGCNSCMVKCGAGEGCACCVVSLRSEFVTGYQSTAHCLIDPSMLIGSRRLNVQSPGVAGCGRPGCSRFALPRSSPRGDWPAGPPCVSLTQMQEQMAVQGTAEPDQPLRCRGSHRGGRSLRLRRWRVAVLGVVAAGGAAVSGIHFQSHLLIDA